MVFDTILKKRGRPKNMVPTALTNGPLLHISLPMAKPIQRLLQHSTAQHTNLANLFRHTPQRAAQPDFTHNILKVLTFPWIYVADNDMGIS